MNDLAENKEEKSQDICSESEKVIVDFNSFPKIFRNEEEALSVFNKLGLPLHIQF